ncbi:putative transporter YutK [Babylonia areolata]|uniref:putative transporter YutK n=1 Tax=Babylonia areolata TaxID=304850 RepID=UPI003FD17096
MDSTHKHQNNAPKPLEQKPPLPTVIKEIETEILFESDDPFLDHQPDDDHDPFDDPSEDEDEEGRLKNSTFVGRVVLHVQQALRKVLGFINDKLGGHFFAILFLLFYIVYFCYAMYYRFGDEGSIRLLWCTLLGIVIASRHRVRDLMGRTSLGRWCTGPKPPATTSRINKLRFFLRWLSYVGIGAFMIYVIVDVGIEEPEKLGSLPGIFIFTLICFLFSTHPSKVNWHTIYWSLGLQFILAVLVMRWQGGKQVVLWIQTRLDGFFANSKPASRLIFGETYTDHYIIFGALPIIFLTNAALSMLYHVGAMQFLVRVIGNSLRFVLGTTAIESTGVAASIFMEGSTALLAIRPYLGGLTRSELFALVTACLASIGGAFLAILAQIGIPVEFMLPAMVISAPATFTVCKLIVPETRETKKVSFSGDLPPDMRYSSILEAAQAGALSVVSLVANVVVSAFALFSLIEWMNTTLTWFGLRVGIQQLTMEKILSYVFFPFSYLMGIELVDCRNVAMLMGLRVSSSSFVALLKMAELTTNRAKFQQYSLLPNATVTYIGDHIVLDQWNVTLIDGYISRRSEAIATYALCGFSGVLSLFITLSVIATLLPKRRHWLVSMAIPLLVAGNLANFMCGCFAGLLADLK